MKYSWKKTYKSDKAKNVRRRKNTEQFIENITVEKIAMLASIAAFFSLIYFIVWSPFFKVKNLNIGDEQVKQIVANQFTGKNILFLRQTNVAGYVINKDPRIDGLVLEKKYPRSLSIKVSYRKPLAVVLSAAKTTSKKEGQRVVKMRKYLIDDQGIVFSQATTSARLPSFELGSKKIDIGDRLQSENVVNYLQILSHLRRAGIEVGTLKVMEQETVEIQLSDGTLVLLSSSRNPEKQIEALQVILTKYKIKETALAKVDLRFDKPVVVYKN